MQTVKLFTLGCKVNQYETQAIREQFENCGFKETANGKPADIYLINTCTVTHRADADSLRLIYRAKRENPQAKIIVTGCLAELDEDKIRNTDGINLIVKNKDKNRILELLNKNNGHNGINDNNDTGISGFFEHTRAFLKIQDGCNNFCSYCKVTLVRGESRSRPKKLIVEETHRLVKNGFKEIVLCGICLGAYGKDLNPKINLVDVINELEKIKGLLRIRLSSIEAGDVSDELIQLISCSKKLCRHLHVPIQSGDDVILKKMNRRYNSGDYRNLIKKIKKCIPDIAITTDVLVGFPGEEEVNFNHTLELVREILPLKVHIFPYSRRKGTPAADNFGEVINPTVIKERMSRLVKLSEECALVYKKQFLNKEMDVLIEGLSKENPGFWEGHTDNYLNILIKSAQGLKNQLISVKLKEIIKDRIIANCY